MENQGMSLCSFKVLTQPVPVRTTIPTCNFQEQVRSKLHYTILVDKLTISELSLKVTNQIPIQCQGNYVPWANICDRVWKV